MGDKIDVDLHNIVGAMGSIMGQMGIAGGSKGKSSAPAPKGKSGKSKAKDRKADKPKQKAKGKQPDKTPPKNNAPAKKPGQKVPVKKP